MKRAFPQKVKPVSCHHFGVDFTVGQPKQAPVIGANRKARTSAAMIGLALSMGASSLLLPRQNDGAVAAETPNESAIASAPLALRIATLPASVEVETATTNSAETAATIRHVVREGQTLWRLAQAYNIGVEAIARANGFAPDTVLRVGQSIKIPASDQAVVVQEVPTSYSAPEGVSPIIDSVDQQTPAPVVAASQVSDHVTSLNNADSQLKADRDSALTRMRQERDKLRNSLSTLNSESEVDASLPEVVSSATAEEQAQSIASEPAAPEQSEQIVAATLEQPTAEISATATVAPLAAPTVTTPTVTAPTVVAPTVTAPTVVAQPSVNPLPVTTYRVKPGDTLDSIARTHNTSPQLLASANQLSDPDWLRISQSLSIPTTATAEASDSVTLKQPTADLNLASSDLSTSDMADSVVPATVSPTAMVPTATVPTPVVPTTVVPTTTVPTATIPTTTMPTAVQPEANEPAVVAYQVNPGDTIDGIARRHDISRSSLIAVNQLDNPHQIRPGQVIQVPVTESLAALQTEATADQFNPNGTLLGVAAPTVPQQNTVIAVEGIQVAQAVDESSLAATMEANSAGDEATVAVAPFTVVPATATPARSTMPSELDANENLYVQNLLSEITTLRQRYRSQNGEGVTPQRSEVVAVSPANTSPILSNPTPAVVNPQFNPARAPEAPARRQAVPAARPSAPAVEAVTATEGGSRPAPERPQPTQVAAAPLGSQNYEPLIQPLTGRMVSPELPPLPAASAYLPDSPAAFNGFIWPARGVMTSGYGWRWGRMHRGIDIGAPTGTPVFAAADGVVETSGWNSGGYGNMVEIRHPDGSMTRYAHHNRNLVRVGQRVEQGQQIAEVGSTGYSTGPHLHFEVHVPNQGTVNPMALLPQR